MTWAPPLQPTPGAQSTKLAEDGLKKEWDGGREGSWKNWKTSSP